MDALWPFRINCAHNSDLPMYRMRVVCFCERRSLAPAPTGMRAGLPPLQLEPFRIRPCRRTTIMSLTRGTPTLSTIATAKQAALVITLQGESDFRATTSHPPVIIQRRILLASLSQVPATARKRVLKTLTFGHTYGSINGAKVSFFSQVKTLIRYVYSTIYLCYTA